jgi:serine/threonine protein kinase/WD40 repeat protein
MMERPHRSVCPQCGTALSLAVADGVCSRCLAAAAFRDEPPPPEETAAEPVNAQFEIIGRLGRGAMGVVYRARQKRLGRDVALKMLSQAAFASEAERERLRREARILASLRHPGIVAIHDAIEDDGCLGFAMELVDGGDLATVTASGPLPQRTAALLMTQIADAITYAHGQGVLHRDLKPSNVLMGADGSPKVTDFGLARLMADAGGGTATGAIVGTPAYSPPEQLLGAGATPSPAGDVYGLGALLYHLLTGRAPFVADNPLSLLHLAEEGSPAPPRLLVPSVPRDLETICLHALARDPRRRYPTAADFADDLRAFLDGRPIRARPAPPVEKCVRWARRRPGLAALGSLTAILVASIIVVLAHSSTSSRALLQTIREGAYVADMRLTERALEEGDLFEASRLLGKWEADVNTGPDLRGFEWRAFREMTRSRHLAMLDGLPPVRRIAWSPDGTRLFAGTEKGDLIACDPANGLHEIARVPLGATVSVLAPAGDGSALLAATTEGRVSLREPTTLDALLELRTSEGPLAACFSPDDPTFSIVHRAGLSVVNRADGSAVSETPIQPPPWFYGSFAPDGSRLALAHAGIEQVSIWRLDRASPLDAATRTHALDMLAAMPAFTPDGRRLAIGRFDGRVSLRWLDSEGSSQEFSAHHGPVTTVAWNENASRLATGSKDQWIRIWDASTARQTHAFVGHTSTINSIAFSPDGSRLASASRDGSIRLWSASPVAEAAPVPTDGRDPFTGWPAKVPPFPMDGCQPVHGLARGTGMLDPTSRLWTADPDASAWSLQATLPPNIDPKSARLSPDGRWLLANIHPPDSPTPREAVWRIVPNTLLQPSSVAHAPPGCGGKFSPDSRFVAQATLEGEISVQQLLDDQPTIVWRAPGAHHAIINSLAFSADSSRFASASSDGTAKLWTTASPANPTTFSAGASSLWCVALSQDFSRIAAAADGGRVHLWDVSRRLTVARFQLPVSSVTLFLTFGPQDTWLAAAGNGWRHFWPAQPTTNSEN